MAEPINLHIHIDVLGPVTINNTDPQQEAIMSELSDAIQANVAEDSVVIQTLDKLAALAEANAGGTIPADEVASDIATLKGEHQKLSDAVTADSTLIPGSSTTGTGPVSAPGSAPGDPTVPPAGTTVQPDPAPVVEPAPDVPAAPVDGGSTGPQEPAAASPAPEAPAAS